MSISSVRMNPSSVPVAMVMSGRTWFVIPLAVSGVVCVSGGSAVGTVVVGGAMVLVCDGL